MVLFGLFPQKIDRHQFQAGDHICTDRNLKTYYHHSIYIGDDRVIHYGRISSEEECKCHRGLDDPIPTTTVDKSGVRKCCVDCFVRNGLLKHSLYRFESGKPVKGLFEGYCSSKNCDDAEVVLKSANQLLKDDNFRDFSLRKHIY